MTRGRAVAAMVGAALLWSIAGVVSRQLERAGPFEATFWRSAFNAAALLLFLLWQRGPGGVARSLRDGGAALWLSGACWAVMFTAFMVAITLTTVANVLVTMALAPLLTALLARFVLGAPLPARTWAAVLAAGAGIAWMYASELRLADATSLTGMAVAFAVPVAAAINWTVLQKTAHGAVDLLPAVLIGAVASAATTLLPSLPPAATGADIAWLALLGVFQLALPCAIAVAAARRLRAPEVALLSLLEIVFGVAWTWLAGAERPSPAVVAGGALVIGALVANEALAMRRGGSAAAGAVDPIHDPSARPAE